MGERESAPPVGQIPEIGGRAGIIIKLGEGRNTALYQKFKDRMDNILSIYADNWDAMSIPNLWTKPTDVEALRDNLGTTLRFSGIPELKQNSETIVSELIKLAKSNESVLRRGA